LTQERIVAQEPDIGNIPLDKSGGDIDMQIVHQPGGKVQATIRDTKHQRAWSGEGTSENAAATEAIRGFTGDRRLREYVKK
jgi:hypothetical protein